MHFWRWPLSPLGSKNHSRVKSLTGPKAIMLLLERTKKRDNLYLSLDTNIHWPEHLQADEPLRHLSWSLRGEKSPERNQLVFYEQLQSRLQPILLLQVLHTSSICSAVSSWLSPTCANILSSPCPWGRRARWEGRTLLLLCSSQRKASKRGEDHWDRGCQLRNWIQWSVCLISMHWNTMEMDSSRLESNCFIEINRNNHHIWPS